MLEPLKIEGSNVEGSNVEGLKHMTKKDYKAIAELINSLYWNESESKEYDTCLNDVYKGLAVLFAFDNDAFDPEIFDRACFTRKDQRDETKA